MTSDATISIALIFSIISTIGVVVTIASTLKKDHQSEINKQLDIERNFVKINLKLDTFCDETKEILKNQEKSNDEIKGISQQIVKQSERIETLFHYHSDHEERIKCLEKGEKSNDSRYITP